MKMEEWKECRLGDYCDFQNGYAFKSSEFKTNGEYKIVKIKELKDGLVKFFDDSASVDIQDINEFEKYKINRNDVLFALTGDPVSKPNPLSWVGRVSIYRSDENALLNQRTCKIKKSEKIDNQFLYYYFRQWENFYALASKATGSASQANISTNTIADTIIKLPPLPIQQKIAAILSSLDDKIELNNKINTNLEQQAGALFKNWFVNFEPFGGKMPEGWKVGKLCDIADYSSEKIEINKLTPETYYSTENMLPSKGGIETATSLPSISHTTRCLPGETIISNIRPYFKKIFYCTEEVAGCSTDVLCFKPKNKDYSEYLYQVLYSDIFFDYMVLGSKGTKMPRGDKQQIMNYPITIPNELYLRKFKTFAEPIFSQIDINRKENKRLSELRDTLLPKLMNGENRQY